MEERSLGLAGGTLSGIYLGARHGRVSRPAGVPQSTEPSRFRTDPQARTAESPVHFNGAAFFNARVEKSKWALEGNILWAGRLRGKHLSEGEGQDERDLRAGHGRARFCRLLAGGWGPAVCIECRRDSPGLPGSEQETGDHGPSLGVTYKRALGNKLRLDLHADGGGFGVGADVDYPPRAGWTGGSPSILARPSGGACSTSRSVTRSSSEP